MKRAIFLVALAALALPAGDITGRWTGTIDVSDGGGDVISTPVRAEFEQRGGVVTGHLGRQSEERGEPIRNGRVEGSRVLFEVVSPETSGVMRFDLSVVDGGRLEGTMKGDVDTGPITGKVRLARAK